MKLFRVIPAFAYATMMASCASNGETVYVTATEWVDPDSGEVVTTEVGAAPAPAATAADGVDWQSEYAAVLDTPGLLRF